MTATSSRAAAVVLEHPPIMLKQHDRRMLNLLNLERFLIDLMSPSGRKTL
jgi:hypothetical protein